MKPRIVCKAMIIILALAALVILAIIGMYFTRIQSIGTIEKLTDYEDGYNLYRMDILYDYDLDGMLKKEYTDNQTVKSAIRATALPFLPFRVKTQDFSCSSFCITDSQGNALMGRNYDFHADTSALMVYCAPKNGYKSVALAALDNVGVQEISSLRSKLATLSSPMICLDGMNEKGVSVSILVVDSESVVQATEKPNLFSTLAIRLVLDRADTTQEAVDLLRSCDMFAVGGSDYHFYVADSSGDARVIEYDCESDTRELVDTPVRTTTNFYQLYFDRVLPNQRNGIYGHGKERYERIEEILTANESNLTKATAWEALSAAQQDGNNEKKSKTQWSAVYDNTQLTAEISIRRNWEDITTYHLTDNTITGRN